VLSILCLNVLSITSCLNVLSIILCECAQYYFVF